MWCPWCFVFCMSGGMLGRRKKQAKKNLKPKRGERDGDRERGWGQSKFQRYNPKPPCDFPTKDMFVLLGEMGWLTIKNMCTCDLSWDDPSLRAQPKKQIRANDTTSQKNPLRKRMNIGNRHFFVPLFVGIRYLLLFPYVMIYIIASMLYFCNIL